MTHVGSQRHSPKKKKKIFSLVNHLRKFLFLLFLFILLIISGNPDSLIIKSEYQISFSYLLTIPTTEIIVHRK